MQFYKTVFALVALVCIHGAGAQTRFGAQGAEGEPNRIMRATRESRPVVSDADALA